MGQSATLRAIDASIMGAFAHAGLTDQATYTPVSGSAIVCRVYVDRGANLGGLDGRLLTNRVTITALMADVLTRPQRGAIFDMGGSEIFKVEEVLNIDESRVVCLVV